ncbi:MAG: succinylglutamate desuccinylase [Cyanobacteria bacterium QS_8_64_29]|nr:MAG: succinylglutamate desuccinylase [Cyanobacteria bacterium QS_8_64_29]
MEPTVSSYALPQLASGDRPTLQLYRFSGARTGPVAYLQSNLHGAEIVGNAVIHELIAWLRGLEPTQLAGEIRLLPACNPAGTNQRGHFFATGRYNPYDGRDWNRIFWDYTQDDPDLGAFARQRLGWAREAITRDYDRTLQDAFEAQAQRAQRASSLPYSDQYRNLLQSLCLDANYAIDIHSSSNRAVGFLYGFSGREASAGAFGLELGVLLAEADCDGVSFDEAFIKPWLALENALAQAGQPTQFERESWTLELGAGMQMQPQFVRQGTSGIQHYLAQQSMVAPEAVPASQRAPCPLDWVSKDQIHKYYAPGGGMVQPACQLGARVARGERLYWLLQLDKTGGLPAAQAVTAEADGLVFDVATNHAVNQGEYVLTVLESAP